MKTSNIVRLSGGFAAATALAFALMAGAGAADAASNTFKTQFVAPKAPVASKQAGNHIFSLTPKAPIARQQAPNLRQIVVEPRQQNSTTAEIVAPKAPVAQPQPKLATLESDTAQPIVADNSDTTDNKPVIEKQVQPPVEKKVEQPAPETKKPVDLKHLAKGDRVFETEDQFIVMHTDGTYDLIARKVHKKVIVTYTNDYNYGYSNYNSYDNYSSSYNSYAPSYSYDNCQ